MSIVHSVTSEGPVTLTQYDDGAAMLYNAETGDAIDIAADDLVKIGRLTIAAHVAAGRLKLAGR